MTQDELNQLALERQAKAWKILEESKIARVWEEAGCRVNVIGSLKMGLLINHNDIDLHVYSSNITEESSFEIASRISALSGVTEMTCINGLHTDEHCMAWHVKYRPEEGDEWKFDIIHIESGSEYDGFFERMAERITAVMTPVQRDTILRLKYETPESEVIHGVEYYEAVIANGVTELNALHQWIESHRSQPPYYWVP